MQTLTPQQVFSVEIVREVNSFVQITHSVVAQQPWQHNATAYYNNQPVWVALAWQYMEQARGSRPFIVLVRDGAGQIAGWWPLLLSKRSLGWRLQGFGQEYSDYVAPYIHTPYLAVQPAIQSALAAALCEHRAAFSMAFFPSLLWQGGVESLLRDRCGWQHQRTSLNLYLHWQAEEGLDALMERLHSNKYRKLLRYEQRRLESMGDLRCESITTQAPLEEAERFFRANYSHGAEQAKVDLWFAYIRATLGGQSRLSLLSLDGEIINMILWFPRGGQVDFFSTVYAQKLAKLSPGKTHLYLFIAQLFNQGEGGMLNFLSGDEPYKQRWATGHFESYRLFLHHFRTPTAAMLALKPLLKRLF
ncbi:Protein involved in cellulose biosynthesis (CelD)-like protein [Magnetococcus marinus MC-1]|uniref:Protein involved in cellulose biosynthesis (CelD)-like protein n=1 Tax=Magnetococcus marinus (strain ATCC BAA-1437 / JCM 17883 / MC-1) TaxID=156889 RepID=A0LAC0_MAGMM|nr:GNAT family N-acetyltransferase [Magnetococcus marinus]ABK44913.1 Protein involved in cellulose biosynthesis (CelD)-like protein [Magnetococcus marinus MC-1]